MINATMIPGIEERVLRACAFLIPIPFFLTNAFPFVVTGEEIHAPRGVPISLVALPLALLAAALLATLRRPQMPREIVPFWACYACLIVYGAVLLAFSPSPIHTMLYGFMWCLPALWLFIASQMVERLDRVQLATDFLRGAFVGSAFIFIPGVVELAIAGEFAHGRITQNYLFPGQYQVAIYSATALSLTLLLNIALRDDTRSTIGRGLFAVYVIITLIAILFTSSREAILLALAGTAAIWALRTPRRSLLVFITGVAAILVLVFARDFIIAELRSWPTLLPAKMALLLEDPLYVLDNRTSVSSLFLYVYSLEPILGLRMTPPHIAYPELSSMLMNPDGRPWTSAHNYYIDALAWLGPVGFVLILTFWLGLCYLAAREIWRQWLYGGSVNSASLGAIVILIALFSNLVNEPFRQPVTVAVFSLAIALFLTSSPRIAREQPRSLAVEQAR